MIQKQDNQAKIRVPILTQSEDWALYITQKKLPFAKYVPILTQSEDWALFFALVQGGDHVGVPILTQSEDWALLP